MDTVMESKRRPAYRVWLVPAYRCPACGGIKYVIEQVAGELRLWCIKCKKAWLYE